MSADYINAAFEAGGSTLLLLNVRRLHRDKRLAGVAILPTVWFNVWGAWNVYYYFHLGQYASWIAGFCVFGVNTTWVAMAIYYRRRQRSLEGIGNASFGCDVRIVVPKGPP